MRVVSLVPSATETLLAWGVDVVACTRFCEQDGLRHVGGTKDPDVAAIASLRPDLVVMDREENRREDAEALAAAGLRVHAMHVVDVDGLAAELSGLAGAVGVDVPSEPLGAPRPGWATAFVPIWRRPWMTIGSSTFGASLLEHLGVRSVFAAHPDRYPTVELTGVAAAGPQLVLLPSEPYPFAARHVPEVERALPGVPVLLVDGQDLFWWGARTPAAVDRLRAALDPVRDVLRGGPPPR